MEEGSETDGTVHAIRGAMVVAVQVPGCHRCKKCGDQVLTPHDGIMGAAGNSIHHACAGTTPASPQSAAAARYRELRGY